MIEFRRIDVSLPIGSKVLVVRDNGLIALTKTRSSVFQTKQGWMVQLEGISGSYLADRCFHGCLFTPTAAQKCLQALRHVQHETDRGERLGKLNFTLIDDAIELAEGRQ